MLALEIDYDALYFIKSLSISERWQLFVQVTLFQQQNSLYYT